MPAKRRTIRIRWWIFLFTFAFLFMSYVQRTSIGIAAERIEPELNVSQMQIGWMMWAFTLMYMLMQLPAGVFGQRFGARKTFTIAGILGAVAMIATPMAPVLLSGTALFLAMVFFQGLLGVAQAPFVPVTAGVYEAWFPSSRWALIQGIGASGGTLGAALEPPVIVLLTQSYGWQGALYWLALPAVALTIVWAWFARDKPHEHPWVTPEELAELDQPAGDIARPMTWRRLAGIAANRDVLLLSLSYVCMNYGFYLLNNWSFLYLVQERHLSALQSGLLAMLPSIGAAVGSAIGGYLADICAARLGARRGYALVAAGVAANCRRAAAAGGPSIERIRCGGGIDRQFLRHRDDRRTLLGGDDARGPRRHDGGHRGAEHGWQPGRRRRHPDRGLSVW